MDNSKYFLQEKGRTICGICFRGSFCSSDQELHQQQWQFDGLWVNKSPLVTS